MTKTTEHVIRERKAHHAALATLSTNPKADGLKLWRKLRKIESEVTAVTTAYCNAETDLPSVDKTCDWALEQVTRILGQKPAGLFVNRDPRGYALKLVDEAVPAGMHTDWGRYGILAPTID